MTIGWSKYEQACREFGALGDFDWWADLWSVLARRPRWSFYDPGRDPAHPALRWRFGPAAYIGHLSLTVARGRFVLYQALDNRETRFATINELLGWLDDHTSEHAMDPDAND